MAAARRQPGIMHIIVWLGLAGAVCCGSLCCRAGWQISWSRPRRARSR